MLNEEGAELLKKVIIKKYGKPELEKIIADENEFHFDFKINKAIKLGITISPLNKSASSQTKSTF